MKKLIMLLSIVSTIGLARDIEIGYPANGEIPNLNLSNNQNISKLLGYANQSINAVDGSNKIFEALGSGGGGYYGSVSGDSLGSMGNSNGGLFDTIDNYYNIFDKGSEQAFNAMLSAGDMATQGLNILAAAPGIFGGGPKWAAIGTNIQLVMNRLQEARKRVDQLKQYKRWLDSIKGLTQGDFKTIAGIKNTLGQVEGILKEGMAFSKEDLNRNFAKSSLEQDMSTGRGWDIKNTKDMAILNDTNKTLMQVSQTDKVLDAIKTQQAKLSEVNATTTLQQLKTMSAQTDLIITLLNKIITDQARAIGDTALKNQRFMQEEIARNKVQKENALRLEQYREELHNKVNSSSHRSGVNILLK